MSEEKEDKLKLLINEEHGESIEVIAKRSPSTLIWLIEQDWLQHEDEDNELKASKINKLREKIFSALAVEFLERLYKYKDYLDIRGLLLEKKVLHYVEDEQKNRLIDLYTDRIHKALVKNGYEEKEAHCMIEILIKYRG